MNFKLLTQGFLILLISVCVYALHSTVYAAYGSVDTVSTASPTQVFVNGWAYDSNKSLTLSISILASYQGSKTYTFNSQSDAKYFTFVNRPDADTYVAQKYGVLLAHTTGFRFNAAAALPSGLYKVVSFTANNQEVPISITTGGGSEFYVVKSPVPNEGWIEGVADRHFLKGWSFYSNDVNTRMVFTFVDANKRTFVVDSSRLVVGFDYDGTDRPDVAEYLVKKYGITKPNFILGFTIDLRAALPVGTYTLTSAKFYPERIDAKVYKSSGSFRVMGKSTKRIVITESRSR